MTGSNRNLALLSVLAVIVISAANLVPTCCAYSSTVDADCNAGLDVNTIDIRNGKDPFNGSLADQPLHYNSVNSKKNFTDSVISSGYSIVMTGTGSYHIAVSVSGASAVLGKLVFVFDGNGAEADRTVTIDTSNPQLGCTKATFVGGSSVPFTISAVTSAAYSAADVELGAVTFYMYEENVNIASSFNAAQNKVTVALKSLVEDVIETNNGSGIIPGNKDSKNGNIDKNDYEIIDESNATTGDSVIRISKVDKKDNTDNITDDGEKFNFNVTIPENVRFVIQIKIRGTDLIHPNDLTLSFTLNGKTFNQKITGETSLSEKTYYVFMDGNNITAQKISNGRAPDQSKWLESENGAVDLHVYGNKDDTWGHDDTALEFRIFLA